jgi:D-arabinose 1-dehydrogenase-like Zn-dependent alcohol dehydrogenase
LMKAIQLTAIGRPLQLRDVPVPQPGPDDVLIRIKAAGICRSDAHYRAGVSIMPNLPVTLGHEMAGVVEKIGRDVKSISVGTRVCVHYLATCGTCSYCAAGHEQFCGEGRMLGKHRDGGYAEWAMVPARSTLLLPPEISFEIGAVMMCSSATSLHAINKARLQPGESVAIFGFGGLGFSALQLAKARGAGNVYAVDVNAAKLKTAADCGAVPVDARKGDPAWQIQQLTNGRGADVALEFVGLPETMEAAVRCLAIFGRAALVALTRDSVEIAPYQNFINKEVEVLGVSDHLASELPQLLEMARDGRLRFPAGAIRTIPLEATAVNGVLDALDRSDSQIRTVIQP